MASMDALSTNFPLRKLEGRRHAVVPQASKPQTWICIRFGYRDNGKENGSYYLGDNVVIHWDNGKEHGNHYSIISYIPALRLTVGSSFAACC